MKIDLSKLPEGTKWIAIDWDGDVFASEEEPERNGFFTSYASSVESAEPLGNVQG